MTMTLMEIYKAGGTIDMSTSWWVPVGPYVKNAELAVRKMTGWKKDPSFQAAAGKNAVILTDGEQYIHCDIRPIKILDHGQYVELERFANNYGMEEVLQQIDGAFNEHEDLLVGCDTCENMLLVSEAHETKDEMLICRVCKNPPSKRRMAKKPRRKK